MSGASAKGRVLFRLCGWGVGGIERATVSVANGLAARGWWVGVFMEVVLDGALLKGLAPAVHIFRADGLGREARVRALRKAIVGNGVEVAVNQRMLPPKEADAFRAAVKGLPVKAVAVLHAPVRFCKEPRGWLDLPRWRARLRLIRSYRRDAAACDAVVLLSKRAVPEFRAFARLPEAAPLCVIPNPLGLRPPAATKENVVLFVGRFERHTKRVHRVLEVWERLAGRFPEWRLELVGDGPERADLEARAKGLPRVAFHGFCDPAPFYAQARIQLLVSDYEGFPLVLAEGMSAGCVPVVLGSYAAVHDLIDGTNGIVVPTPFDAAAFAEVVGHVMASPRLCEALGCHARAIAQRYDEGAVVAEWDALLAGLRGRRADGAMVPKKGG